MPEESLRITDPKALRALAHRGRNRILERLQVHGPATATECAEVAGLSPSACSYHLRMLARYGFVEEELGRGDGRERLWRARVHAWSSDVGGLAPEEARAVDGALVRVLLARSDEKVLAWVGNVGERPPEWEDASLVSNNTLAVTAAELAEIGRALQAVLAPYAVRRRRGADGSLPAGSRMVHAALRLAPEVTEVAEAGNAGNRTSGPNRAQPSRRTKAT